MSYYKRLGLQCEPFSTNPDPDFFYQSKEHKAAFYRLRVAIDLKRGSEIQVENLDTMLEYQLNKIYPNKVIGGIA